MNVNVTIRGVSAMAYGISRIKVSIVLEQKQRVEYVKVGRREDVDSMSNVNVTANPNANPQCENPVPIPIPIPIVATYNIVKSLCGKRTKNVLHLWSLNNVSWVPAPFIPPSKINAIDRGGGGGLSVR